MLHRSYHLRLHTALFKAHCLTHCASRSFLYLRRRFKNKLTDPSCILLPPLSPHCPEANQIHTIAAALSTRFQAKMVQVNAALKNAVVQEWGKVCRIDSDAGDTMRSCSLGVVAEDTRDATYVRVRSVCSLPCQLLRHI
jgi:hypothetical protein